MRCFLSDDVRKKDVLVVIDNQYAAFLIHKQLFTGLR